MKNRDRIIRYYQGTDNGELAARLIDLADSTAKGRPYAVSEFVSPGAVQIGETILRLTGMGQGVDSFADLVDDPATQLIAGDLLLA